jgi:hypothetical protein
MANKNKAVANKKVTVLNNRFEIGHALGSGAFGTIYKGKKITILLRDTFN